MKSCDPEDDVRTVEAINPEEESLIRIVQASRDLYLLLLDIGRKKTLLGIGRKKTLYYYSMELQLEFMKINNKKWQNCLKEYIHDGMHVFTIGYLVFVWKIYIYRGHNLWVNDLNRLNRL